FDIVGFDLREIALHPIDEHERCGVIERGPAADKKGGIVSTRAATHLPGYEPGNATREGVGGTGNRRAGDVFGSEACDGAGNRSLFLLAVADNDNLFQVDSLAGHDDVYLIQSLYIQLLGPETNHGEGEDGVGAGINDQGKGTVLIGNGTP